MSLASTFAHQGEVAKFVMLVRLKMAQLLETASQKLLVVVAVEHLVGVGIAIKQLNVRRMGQMVTTDQHQVCRFTFCNRMLMSHVAGYILHEIVTWGCSHRTN